MSDNFFYQKKEWSKYKDLILGYYLTPYLEKVKYLKKPILIIDCCAGPGLFDDGSDGSPLIIAKHVKTLYDKGVNIKGLFLEKKKKFFAKLQNNLGPFSAYAEAKHIDFMGYLENVRSMAKNSTIFLYVDPYGIKELLFSELSEIYNAIMEHNSSVEVLLNFNSPAFVRCALVALKMDTKDFDVEIDDDFLDEIIFNVEGMTTDQMDAIAGGNYWKSVVSDLSLSFFEKEQKVTEFYMKQMNKYFPNVCNFPIQKKYGQLPKYRLIYGTRHEDGILLMNDTMYKAREQFLNNEFADGRLFDTRPHEELKDISLFTKRLFEITEENKPISRKDLKIKAMQEFFCCYNSSDYSETIKKLLIGSKGMKLYSHSGKTRINDDVLLSTKPFT
ncbi:MAG: three-Cys-motif partner protein TcmP [Proteobacteria bacterium]|nr:three-Cys-motif partner protein TcmP [Pseudomonadota bacterium]